MFASRSLILGVSVLFLAVLAGSRSPAEEVTIVWSCAGAADVYLNGKALRDAKPDFRTRDDETGKEFTAKTRLKVGDALTVGARRIGSGVGFKLAAFDSQKRLVWQTETSHWRSYTLRDPRSAKRWHVPTTAAHAKMAQVSVPQKAAFWQISIHNQEEEAKFPLRRFDLLVPASDN